MNCQKSTLLSVRYGGARDSWIKLLSCTVLHEKHSDSKNKNIEKTEKLVRRWRAKGMAILHCRCQESTALLSVLNSCESSMSRALPRSAPPACLAHGSLEASIHTRRRRLHGADKRLSLGAASRRPVDAAPQFRVSARTNRPFLLLGLGGTVTAQLLRENGKARSREKQRRRRNLLPVVTHPGDGSSDTARNELPPLRKRGTKSSQSQKSHATSAGVDPQANGTYATGPHD